MNDLSQPIGDMHAEKLELLEMMLREEGGQFNSFPLSFSQQRLWLLDQMGLSASAYNFPAPFRFTGTLDVNVLRKCLNEIVRRHESLRTIFISVSGQPVQVVTSSLCLPLPVVDLRDMPGPAREYETARLAREDARLRFDLSAAPLLRTTLLCLSNDEHVMLLTVHHIVFDGWSKRLVLRETAALYEAYLKGEPSPLPELAVQYPDYTIWQREWSQIEFENQLSYWRRQLGQDLPVLDLPPDQPRHKLQSFRGKAQARELTKALSDVIRAMSAKDNSTLAMTLLAAFKILLHRHTRQEDIVVGSPIAGRNRQEIENLIGCFVNTIVLRTDLSGNPSFRELLQRVRVVMLEAYANQDVPFERLLDELRLKRDFIHPPLVQVLFNVLNFADDEIRTASLSIQSILFDDVESKFDLTLYVKEKNDRIQLIAVYNTDLFEQARMTEMLAQLETLLQQIVEDPDRRIGDYTLVTENAKKQLPNPAQRLVAQGVVPVQTLFSRQARLAPGRVSIADRCERWTYGELERRSNQLANYLLSCGVERSDVVAIHAHRCAGLVWALIGVLKAGAAFLILDRKYPAKRLINQIEQASPKAWVQVGQPAQLEENLRVFVERRPWKCQIDLPSRAAALESGFLEECSDSAEPVEVEPDDLAYIAFTSGSMGKPKAIEGTHRPLSHFAQWHAKTFDLGESDRFSMLSGLSHDPLLRDIFTPLHLGAALFVPDAEEMLSQGALAQWMRQEAITVAHLTPATINLLTGIEPGAEILDGEFFSLDSLRYAFFGGDVLTRADVSRFQRLAPAARCVNFYGTTETPQAMSYRVIQGSAEQARHTVPLGRGIEGAQLLILNPYGGMAGLGEVGEIHIRSPYLAKGYLGDQPLTNDRFITNPLTREASDRLYKSGDLARYLPDGDVEYLGRCDDQLKLRGYRIELAEIEAALCEHPCVRASAAVCEDQGAEKRLLGYVEVKDGQEVTASRLREHLRQRLPEYMLPSMLTIIPRLPLTPNGKLDRRALLASSRIEQREDPFAPADTPTQKELAEIWIDLLRREQVGVHDNFFDLGGNSLLVMQLLSRVQSNFGIRVSASEFFNHPTIDGLAEAIETTIIERSDPSRIDELLGLLECADGKAFLTDPALADSPASSFNSVLHLNKTSDRR